MEMNTKMDLVYLVLIVDLASMCIYLVYEVDDGNKLADDVAEFKSYCRSPYINMPSNELTRSVEYCDSKFKEIFGVE